MYSVHTVFLIIGSVCADLGLAVYWPGLMDNVVVNCILHYFPSREMTNAFCHIFSRKFRKMRTFFYVFSAKPKISCKFFAREPYAWQKCGLGLFVAFAPVHGHGMEWLGMFTAHFCQTSFLRSTHYRSSSTDSCVWLAGYDFLLVFCGDLRYSWNRCWAITRLRQRNRNLWQEEQQEERRHAASNRVAFSTQRGQKDGKE